MRGPGNQSANRSEKWQELDAVRREAVALVVPTKLGVWTLLEEEMKGLPCADSSRLAHGPGMHVRASVNKGQSREEEGVGSWGRGALRSRHEWKEVLPFAGIDELIDSLVKWTLQSLACLCRMVV